MTTSVTADVAAAAAPEMVGGFIPMLDVGPFLAGEPGARERLATQLRFAFEKVGFYYMRGHGVPQSLIDAVFAEASRFHAQPMEKKLALKVNEHNIGYFTMRSRLGLNTKANGDTEADFNEYFFVRRERTPDDPDVIANKRMRGLNQWPPGLPGFRETILTYMNTLEGLGRRLVPLYATALGLSPDWFDAFFEKPNLILRLSRYAPEPDFEENEFSLPPHTDSGFMTLLAPSKVPGLSIRLPDGSWFDAPSIEGAYIVNGGDILHRWTNERFLATLHRVRNRSERDRFAFPFFFDCHPDSLIECVPTCCSPSNSPKYKPFTYDEYALAFAKRVYAHMDDHSRQSTATS